MVWSALVYACLVLTTGQCQTGKWAAGSEATWGTEVLTWVRRNEQNLQQGGGEDDKPGQIRQ